jgi:hypothetical protein
VSCDEPSNHEDDKGDIAGDLVVEMLSILLAKAQREFSSCARTKLEGYSLGALDPPHPSDRESDSPPSSGGNRNW